MRSIKCGRGRAEERESMPEPHLGRPYEHLGLVRPYCHAPELLMVVVPVQLLTCHVVPESEEGKYESKSQSLNNLTDDPLAPFSSIGADLLSHLSDPSREQDRSWPPESTSTSSPVTLLV